MVAAACIGTAEVTPSGASRTVAPPPSAGAPTAPSQTAAAPSDSPTPTEAPTAAPTEAPTVVPTDEPTASPSGATGSVEVCAGTDDNRTFYESVAAAFDWPVYCPVLPLGWFVTAGRYRSAGGGWMEIAYRGPGGARLELFEGAFCQENDGCVPSGEDAGSAAFGDQTGALVLADDGSLSVVVARGEQLSWLAMGTGLELEAFRSIAAAFNRVD